MVVACVNAIGQAIPPYVIYNAKTLNPEWMKDGPPGTKYAMGGLTLIYLSIGLTITS